MWIRGAQADAGLHLRLEHVVGFRGGQQWPRLGQEQVVGPFDRHDVGVLGDRPERPVRRIVHPCHRVVRPQVGQRRMKPGIVRVRGRIRQHLRGVIHRRRAHPRSSSS